MRFKSFSSRYPSASLQQTHLSPVTLIGAQVADLPPSGIPVRITQSLKAYRLFSADPRSFLNFSYLSKKVES